jgi:hypothetical protein
MRTQKEIEKELDKIITEWGDVTTTKPEQHERAAVAAQALVWILGDGLSASQYLEDTKEDV